MADDLAYLRPNIQVEPLINRWYAWVQIIPPATGAFNIKERHLKTLEAYLQSPELHAAAVQDPKLRGGPFIDLQGEKLDQVQALLDDTRRRTSAQLAFAKAVYELDGLLATKADGYSLQPLYRDIPEMLRGYVELYYDRQHRPAFRFYEALLYNSEIYDPGFQSVALSMIEEDCGRPFVFSTPNLDAPGKLHMPVPFATEGLDLLFQAKRTPTSVSNICDSLGVGLTPDERQLFESFFTKDAPKPYAPYDGDKLRIRYFGHACILLELQGTSILIDPVLSYTYESDISRFTYDDLPDEIDYALITHSHHDHILVETMLQIRHKVRKIIVPKNATGTLQDPSLKLMLNAIGFDRVETLDEFGTLPIPGGVITGFPFIGEHHDLNVDSKLVYHIRHQDVTVLAMADSCNVSPELYAHVHRLIGDVDILFLGMECDGAPLSWVYGPLFAEKPERSRDRSRRGRGSNFAEGMDLVHRFNCREVYVYAMGEEPWVRYILGVEYTPESNPIVQSNLLVEECRREGRIAERLFGEKEIR